MKKIFYYTTTAIIISCGITQAQTCVPTPTCSTLGYTSTTACDGGLKCPFGEAWNCDLANKMDELEKQVASNQSQGEVCLVGSILYSDMTCYENQQKGKTPIGVVVYIDKSGKGQALALNSVNNGAKYLWSTESVDITELLNYGYASSASEDYDSCGNTAKIIAAGDKSKYPAAWAAHEYSTEGTSAGDWCLPAAGIFSQYKKDTTTSQLIASTINENGGTMFTNGAWSSSEYNNNETWRFYNSDGFGLNYNYKNTSFEVRPVLEF